jgi:1-aminocyclopropane-1-carboxylate deaminase
MRKHITYNQVIEIQEFTFDCINNTNILLKMARLDKIHDLASGNKIYKLLPIIKYVKANNFRQILTFGGAFSNHVHALALMANSQGIESIAVIRGEPHYAKNPTLSDAQNVGMRLVFVNRQEYKLRNDQDYLTQLQSRFPDALIIPEGGSSQLAIQGCAQMALDIVNNQHPHSENELLAVASGTGATAAGLVCGLADNQRLVAYSVLKDKSLQSRIAAFIRAENDDKDNDREHIHENHHGNGNDLCKPNYTIQNADFGGYAKFEKPLLDFILSWLDQTGILLDPIYTSKMCRRVIEQVEAGEFKTGQVITLIHSGGLQGWRGMQQRVESIGGANAWKQISLYLESA